VDSRVENQWTFYNFSTPLKRDTVIPGFPQWEESRIPLSSIGESLLLNTINLSTTTKFFI
jgi:hypothetical protein